jgi:tetratricopeptide (TPR) repeat protein
MSNRDVKVVEELGRILASEPFVASPMLASFLRFVVQETLAGRGDRLKAYTIAVGALDRSDDFDPNDNPLVRVQARRLRQALERWYLTDGRDAELRIELPLGSYVPEFVERVASAVSLTAPAAALPAETASGDGRRATAIAKAPRSSAIPHRIAVAALLLSLATGAAIGVWYAGTRITPPAPPARTDAQPADPKAAAEAEPGGLGLDAGRVLPLLTVTVELREPRPFDFDPEVYRSRIEGFARRFDDTVVVTRRSTDYPTPAGQPHYRLHFLVAREGGTTNAYIQLIRAGDERVVRSTALVLDRSLTPATASFTTPDDLAFVRDVVQLHGAITQDLVNVPEIGGELACLTRAWNYYLDSSPQNHREARDCLVPLAAANPSLVPALTMLGAAYMSEYRQDYNRLPGDPLVRAEQALRRATRVAPASSAPYQTLQNLLLIRGDIEAAVAAGARSVQNNPEDMTAVGGYGAVLARIGRYEEAVHLLTRAAANSDVPPKWLQFYTFLALNNLGRTREADEQVTLFEGSTSSLYLAAAAIRAHRRGDEIAAGQAIAAILKIEPSFREDPKDFLRRRGFTDLVADRLLVDLAAAGLYRSRT